MKTFTSFLFFVITLLQTTPINACTCGGDKSFCETVNENYTIVEVEIINKYDTSFYEHIDVKVTEILQAGINIDTLTVVSFSGLYCHDPLSNMNIGDSLLINFYQTIGNISNFEKFPAIDFFSCHTNFLRLSNSTVSGHISPGLDEQDYLEFKNQLTNCIDMMVSNEELELLENAIQISPNPFSENINIDFENISVSKISLEIFSAQGEKIIFENLPKQSNSTFSTADFSPGIYFIKINLENNFIIKKIVKQ